MSNEPQPSDTDEAYDEDLQNDDVIGVAVRRSLWFIVLLGIPVIGILIVLNLTKKVDEDVEETVTLPTERKEVAGEIPKIPLAVQSPRDIGIDFVHRSGKRGEKLLPETMGSGVAVLDANGDSFLDLFFVNSMNWPSDDSTNDDVGTNDEASNDAELATTSKGCKLYLGDGNWNFKDASETAGMTDPIYGMGVAAADYDNDGDTDLFVSAVGLNRLYQNEGNGTFVDVSSTAGVQGDADRWSTSCGFFDYDNDGNLDLFVCNYVDWNREADLSQKFTLDGQTRAYGPPRAFAGSFSYLYHNEGDGTFIDVSEKAGIQVLNKETEVPLGKAMGVSPVDVDSDGYLDIVVANDTVQNFLFKNNRDGTFTEMASPRGIAFDRATGNARGAMGIDSVRYRGDGTLAIGIGNFAGESSALYMARPGKPRFVDAAMHTGFGPPSRAALTFGLFFWDADLDGRYDVLGANGHLEEEISQTQSSQTYAQPPQFFWNAGRASSSEIALVKAECVGTDFCQPIVGRGAVYGDFDGDGDQDVVITVSDGPPSVFRNDQEIGHHYLRVKLNGTESNRDGIGTSVKVIAGEQTWIQTLMPTKSYLSQCENTLTFGLGKRDSVDRIELRWPSGIEQVVDAPSIDQTVTIKESK